MHLLCLNVLLGCSNIQIDLLNICNFTWEIMNIDNQKKLPGSNYRHTCQSDTWYNGPVQFIDISTLLSKVFLTLFVKLFLSLEIV